MGKGGIDSVLISVLLLGNVKCRLCISVCRPNGLGDFVPRPQSSAGELLSPDLCATLRLYPSYATGGEPQISDLFYQSRSPLNI